MLLQQFDQPHLGARVERRLGDVVGHLALTEGAAEGLLGLPGRGPAVVAGDDRARELHLDLHRVDGAHRRLLPLALDLVHRQVGEQLEVAPHQVVADAHQLAEHLGGRLADADVVAEALAHLLDAVQPLEQRHGEHDLRFEVVLAHDVAADEQVELLVGAAHLDVGFQRDAVVGLRQRVEDLVHEDGDTALEARLEVVALEHAGDGVARGQLDEALRSQLAQPAAVEVDDCLVGIEDLEDLLLVGLGVGLEFLARHRRAQLVAAAGVADHAGEVADQEDDLVAEVLEVAHLAQDHRVAEVQVGRGRVEADLDLQLAAGLAALLEALREVLARDQVHGAAGEVVELLLDRNARVGGEWMPIHAPDEARLAGCRRKQRNGERRNDIAQDHFRHSCWPSRCNRVIPHSFAAALSAACTARRFGQFTDELSWMNKCHKPSPPPKAVGVCRWW